MLFYANSLQLKFPFKIKKCLLYKEGIIKLGMLSKERRQIKVQNHFFADLYE